jgi:nitroimidazol reductase NimA-like FMN-containing flavoprotein (pyridoxamine 5'-phosphate oxidase superfamily)
VDAAERRLDNLLESQSLAVLATEREGAPYTSLLAFAAAGRSVVYLATTRSSRKWANLASNQNVSLLLDDRANDAADFTEAAAATGIGTACECPAEDEEHARLALAARHPHLTDFLNSPSTSVVRVEIERWYVVQRFQAVTMIDVST